MTAFGWALLTACIWGVVPILEKIGLSDTNPFVGLFYRSLGVIFGLLVFGFFILNPTEIRSVNIKSALLLILGGFLASFVAQLVFYHGLKIGEVSKVVPISASYPLIAFLLAILFLGETFSLLKGLGVVLIICGIWALKLG